MRIEAKQGKHGKWRWLVRSDDARTVLFLSPVNQWHETPDDAIGAAKNHLWDVAFELRPVWWFDWFPTRDMRRIQERVEFLPVDVTFHEKSA